MAGLLLVGKGKPKGEPDGDEAEGGMGAKDAAIDAFITGFEEKNRAAMSDALTSFVKACGPYKE